MTRTDFRAYLEESRGLERDILAELVRSRRLAWRVAGLACGTLGLVLVGFLVLLPLKKVEPFVVRVDSATGGVDIVSMLTEAPASYGEVVNKYWLNRYVLSRESYDYQTIQETYDTTVLLSAASVQREFHSLFEGPQGRDKVLGDRVKYVVRVLSITPAKDTAVVRFVRIRRTNDPNQGQEEHLVATLGFQFVAAPLKETDRLVNPLGFQVTSYRVDPETLGG